MYSPRVRGIGHWGPRAFDFFMEARVNFSTPGHLVNVKFLLPGELFSFRCVSNFEWCLQQERWSAGRKNINFKFWTQGQSQVSKFLPRGKNFLSQIPVGSTPTLLTLGLNIDWCTKRFSKLTTVLDCNYYIYRLIELLQSLFVRKHFRYRTYL